uniref:DUF455 domain-containing protein n=1 Tax=Magnetococcus massalia (strain MO-1) TaxID=451514 RepID=A0A1S7LE99_MAGMO|nr:Conserved protein of unknown function [Candidatus Magnetococcus massalia]
MRAVEPVELAREALASRDPMQKVVLTRQAVTAWQEWLAQLDPAEPLPGVLAPPPAPGAPDKPELVSPHRVAKRKLGAEQGRAIHLHALTHIEFVATNLAWDAVLRFADLPAAYYADWVQVALEEARHFELLAERLGSLGHQYGDFTAHAGLWQMAEKTAEDPLLRMMLVPRYLEARALEAVPIMQQKFRAVGDAETAELLGLIGEEEVGHVAAGSRWFGAICTQRGVDRQRCFADLLQQHLPRGVKGPLNRGVRQQAGFTDWELDLLEQGPDARGRAPSWSHSV